ncbi:MAG: large subunit ribosomal protein L29 [Puniceicoccaceae bacterium 5H]|nr:MAG: large subunit ribosomal protein L29 [Puniceicoccaceae bacterium 5H]
MALETKELREHPVAELEKQLRDLQEKLLKARLDKLTGQLEKTHLLKEYRRDIARLLTVINEKNRQAATAQA